MKKLPTIANRLLHPPMWVRLVLFPVVFSVLMLHRSRTMKKEDAPVEPFGK